MGRIASVATAVPQYRHKQEQVLNFMQNVYAANDVEKRKLKYLYHQGGIKTRYSVLPDYSLPAYEWTFYPASENLEPFPSLEQRMKVYNETAPALSIDAIENCIRGKIKKEEITHLITVSCTGMSAPGLDLQILEHMGLPCNIFRTSVNFMGCYAAIHALKLADALSREEGAKVMIVCTELCTLHFQKDYTTDSITSSLIFGDGSAAVLVVNDDDPLGGIKMKRFYSEVAVKGKKDMCWEMSSTGFLMTLSGYVPQLIEEDFEQLVARALEHNNMRREEVTDWCLHPGGKKILSALQKSMQLEDSALLLPHQVLEEYGNMSSPTILFVLKRILETVKNGEKRNILGAAFGPGLTMETFMLSHE